MSLGNLLYRFSFVVCFLLCTFLMRQNLLFSSTATTSPSRKLYNVVTRAQLFHDCVYLCLYPKSTCRTLTHALYLPCCFHFPGRPHYRYPTQFTTTTTSSKLQRKPERLVPSKPHIGRTPKSRDRGASWMAFNRSQLVAAGVSITVFVLLSQTQMLDYHTTSSERKPRPLQGRGRVINNALATTPSLKFSVRLTG